MPNGNLNHSANISSANGEFEKHYYRELVENLRNDFKNYALTKRTIPFFQLYSWFNWKIKISKEEAKKTISEMAKRDLLELVVFHGVRIK